MLRRQNVLWWDLNRIQKTENLFLTNLGVKIWSKNRDPWHPNVHLVTIVIPDDIVYASLAIWKTASKTLLDGNFGAYWFYSIGYTYNHNDGGVRGQPTYLYGNPNVASKTQLFIKPCTTEPGKALQFITIYTININ